MLDQSAPIHDPTVADGPSVEAMRRAMDSLGCGVLVHDADGHLTQWNPTAERLLGLGILDGAGAPQLLFADGTALTPSEHPARVTLATGTPISGATVGVQHGDGRLTWLSVHTSVLRDQPGDPAKGVVTTLVDVTESRRMHEELERLSLVARRTGEAVIIANGAGEVDWVNDAFTRLYGWSLAEMIGTRPGARLQGPETNPETIVAMRQAIRNGESWMGEILNYRKDGTPLWLELAITPVLDERYRITHFVSLAHDITARRHGARRLNQLSAAVGATEDGIAIVDSFQEFKFVNDAYANLFGYDRGEDLQGKSWRKLFDEVQLQRFDDVVLPNLWAGDRWRGEVLGRNRTGETFPAEIAITLLPGGSMVSVVRDITERKTREAEQARLIAILEATPDLVAISSADGSVPYVNRAGRRMLGIGDANAGALRLDDLFPDWARDVVREIGIPTAEDHGVWSGETALRRRDATEVPVSQVIVAHRNAHGDVEYHSTIMRDITERKEAEDALRRMSLQDQLTQLYNRRGFFLLAQQALNAARKNPGHCILLYFDLNDFKAINDTHGHKVGDEALKEVAEILGETFRDSDVLGRLGGDEFVALAVNCLDPSGDVLLHRLDERLAAHNALPDRTFKLSIGRGLARFDLENPKNLQQLLDQADLQLYEDKRVRKAARAVVAASVPRD
ncbi:MAG: PAS domain S-box protein [Gemmatimonadaceae bacterium]